MFLSYSQSLRGSLSNHIFQDKRAYMYNDNEGQD